MAPLFSVIIPACDRAEQLSWCLDRLSYHTQKDFHLMNEEEPLNYEVIVGDDSNHSGIKDLIEDNYPWVSYVEGMKSGPAENRNIAAAKASGKWLIFTDDDCLPESDWLINYHRAMIDHPDSLAFEGRIEALTKPENDLWRCPINETGGNFWSANIAVDKDLFFSIHGFDQNFPYPAYEDSDIYLRLKKLTHIPFIGNALIKHPIVYCTFWDTLKREFRIMDSRAYLLIKHSKDNPETHMAKTIALEIKTYTKHFLLYFKKFHIQGMLLQLSSLFLGVPRLTFYLTQYFILSKRNSPHA